MAVAPLVLLLAAVVPSSTEADAAVHERAMQATVRIKVEEPDGNAFATGTVVDTHGEEALVLTCAHVFRATQGKAPIAVEIFQRGEPRRVPGQLISFDLERDVALVAIRPGVAIAPMRVSATPDGQGADDRVFSIGCDRGAEPQLQTSHIVSTAEFQGQGRLWVRGAPVDGRSGGGLFAADGRLIGVCRGADYRANEGLYAGLDSVQHILQREGLEFVFKQHGQPGAQPANTNGALAAPAMPELPPSPFPPPADNRFADHGVVPASHHAPQPAHGLPAPGTPPQLSPRELAVLEALRQTNGDAELMIIVRPRNNRGESIVVETPSPAFWNEVGELQRAAQPLIRGQKQ